MIDKLDKIFSLKFEDIIWKILFEDSTQNILIETRNQEKVSFALLALETSKIIEKEVSLLNPKISAQAIFKDFVVLHHYTDISQPFGQGISVFDLKNKILLWQNKDFLYHDIRQEKLWIEENNTLNQIFEVNWKTGDFDKKISLKDIKDTSKRNKNSFLKYPITYRESDKYFEVFQNFLQKKLNISINTKVNYLEYGNFIIIAYFYKTEYKKIINEILVLDKTNQIHFHNKLGEGLSLDTFLIYQNFLCFIRNKKEFITYKL